MNFQCTQLEYGKKSFMVFHDLETHGLRIEDIVSKWMLFITEDKFTLESLKAWINERYPDVVVWSRAEARELIPLIRNAENGGGQ